MFVLIEAVISIALMYFVYKSISQYNRTLAIVITASVLSIFIVPIILKIAIILFGTLFYLGRFKKK